MKINKELQANAYYNPTKETITKSIAELCEEAKKAQIIMPIFQRDLAWTLAKKIALLNFQLNGSAPVSPISMNKIGDKGLEMSHVELITRKPISPLELEGKLGVVDGQQRISTNFEVYYNLPSIEKIVLDLGKGKFIDLKDNDIKKNQIPAGVLYNSDPKVYTNYLSLHPDLAEFEVSSLLNQIRTKYFNYFYTVNYAKNLTGEEQIEWFDVLNLAGSRVPKVQMELTKLQVKGLDFYREFSTPFQEKLELAGLDLFIQKNTEVSIPLATLNPAVEIVLAKKHTSNYSPIPSDAKENIISDLTTVELRKCFQLTLDGLQKAVDFIETNGLPAPKRIDYLTYLTGYFVFKTDPLTLDQTNKLIEWYEDTDFVNKSNKDRRELFSSLLTI